MKRPQCLRRGSPSCEAVDAALREVRKVVAMMNTVVRKGISFLFDREHKREATQALLTVERQALRPLSHRVRQQAEEYAVKILGSRAFAPWLFLYAAVAGEFRKGWIPDNFYGRIVCPNINGAFRAISGVKTVTRRLFQSDWIPDVAYLIDRRYFDCNMQPISMEEAAKVVFLHSDEVVVKMDMSGKGMGVRILSQKDFNPASLAASTARAVIQSKIAQHRVFDSFVPQGATTLRLTTVREPDGMFRVRAAYLRIPCGVDKFVRPASVVRVAVDRDSGILAETGYLSDWTKVESHPQSGAAFCGISIPGFFDAVKLCQDLHALVPQVGCIGWDVIVDTESRAWIVEWNAGHNDVKFSEAVTGPCFHGLGWERLRPTKRTWEL
jgi:hypothetical protein